MRVYGRDLRPGDMLWTDVSASFPREPWPLSYPRTLGEPLGRVGSCNQHLWSLRAGLENSVGGWWIIPDGVYEIERDSESERNSWDAFTLLWPAYVAARLLGQVPR